MMPIVLPVAAALAVLGLWEWAAHAFAIAPTILPPPSLIVKTTVRIHALLIEHGLQTAWESILGLALATASGLAIGLALSYSRVFRLAVYPNMVFFQLIPKVALAPLFIMWFGIGIESRLAFAVFIAFFPIAISTALGLGLVDPNYIRYCRGLTASEWQIFSRVRFPFALPSIFSGLKIGVTMAFIGIIVGEFITSQSGLGYLILFASARAETAVIFAAIALLCTIGLAVFGAVALLERFTRARWGVNYAG